MEWMKNLTLYLMLSGIVIHLLPEKKYEKYINVFSGLIVIVIMSGPLTYLFHISTGDIEAVLMMGMDEQYVDDMWINEKKEEKNYLDLSLNEQLKQEIQERIQEYGFSVEKVNTVLNDKKTQLLYCEVIIHKKEQDNFSGENIGQNENPEEDIKNYLLEVYNIESKHIYVVRR